MNLAEHLAIHASVPEEPRHRRPSGQARPVDPDAGEPPHPRMVAMAEAMRDLAATGGVQYRDLVRAGFSSAEIIEFQPGASRLAEALSCRQTTIDPDRLEDIVLKAKAPAPNDPPMPNGVRESQALFQDWGRYCAARSAYLLDPWTGQRERCLDLLMGYLQKLPLLPRDRKHVQRKTAEAMTRGVTGGRQ